MSSDVSINVERLSKCYQIYGKPRDRLLQMLMRGRRQYYQEFWALRDISFEVRRGETVGIIGRNGSGKSTLLQLICGTLTPTEGTVEVNGRIAALLELGAGFNPEFTGRENVYLAAGLYGLSREEVDARFESICDFADIGEFVEQPVKTYSSGMFVRLAFAVIAHVDADILVIDEALSVGDAYFVQKCMRFLRQFMERGTLLFCSHDIGAVINLCKKAIWLDHGKMVMQDSPKVVSEHYLAALCAVPDAQPAIAETVTEAATDQTPPPEDEEYRDAREPLVNASNLRNEMEILQFDPGRPGFGAGGAKIVSVRLLDKNKKPLAWVVGGEDVILEIRAQARQELSRPIIGFLFRDRLGQSVFSDNTYLSYRFNEPTVHAGETLTARFEFRLPVMPRDEYSIAVSIGEGTQEQNVQHHWVHEALIVRVHASVVCMGLIGVPMKKISLEKE
ncbi:MAG: ABC transporter ATP-binding protein [Proteobacteria bacterium]|nr:ABC transporter ATP-binding protein [Pseudomonadota bacterium]MCL2308638.1 ABC transporter ATP-binding protein [Pseudomonadota bacterium]